MLLFKLGLTPALIASASLAGRRWGPAVSGWLVGLPLTSGPIAFFLVLDQGAAFAHTAAIGTMLGAATQGVFCLAYGHCAARLRWRWPMALLMAAAAFATATVVARALSGSVLLLYALVVACLAAALKLMPREQTGHAASDALQPPRWDIPARMLIATSYVLLLTEMATYLGPQLTGLLSPFPMYGAILAVFAHAQRGSSAAVHVLRGLLFGLFGFASFFVVVALLVERVGIALTFAAAICTVLCFQGASLSLMHRSATSRTF